MTTEALILGAQLQAEGKTEEADAVLALGLTFNRQFPDRPVAKTPTE